MGKWKGIVAENFTPAAFENYVNGLEWKDWKPKFIVLHNTGIPSLEARPNGLSSYHIRNLEVYYSRTKGWSAGPHLFVDDIHGIWVFTPLTTSGVHSPSWNGISLGVEMLGDYDQEEFNSGRGAIVRDNTVAAIAILSKALNIDPSTRIKLHREDPGTDHHCPGDNVDKEAFIELVKQYSGVVEVKDTNGIYVVGVDVLAVRVGPGKHYNIVGRVRRGEEVQCTGAGDALTSWLPVITKDSTVGWLAKRHVTKKVD